MTQFSRWGAAPPVRGGAARRASRGRGGDGRSACAEISSVDEARTLALRILDRAPRTAAELTSRLIAKGVSPATAEELVGRFSEVGLVDDAALAEVIVRTRHTERGLARRAIASELRRRGIDPVVGDAALEQIDESDERARALELAGRRARQLAGVDRATLRRRIGGMLGRRGYGPDVVTATLRALEADTDDGDEPFGGEQDY